MKAQINKLKEKSQQFAGFVDNLPPIRWARQANAVIAAKADQLPKPVAAAFHATPFVNIFVHYYKEQGLDQRLPELRKQANAEMKWKTLDEEVKRLSKEMVSLNQAIQAMTTKRRTLADMSTPNSKGLKALKGKASRKFASWQVSQSKINNETKKLRRTREKARKINTRWADATREKALCDAALQPALSDGRATTVKKEKKLYRNIFRASLIGLTAAAIAAIALTAFSLIPPAIGFAPATLLGVTVGAHLAICMTDTWNRDVRHSWFMAVSDKP